jgi:hypothetical protein
MTLSLCFSPRENNSCSQNQDRNLVPGSDHQSTKPEKSTYPTCHYPLLDFATFPTHLANREPKEGQVSK